jgi:hypothetical protein
MTGSTGCLPKSWSPSITAGGWLKGVSIRVMMKIMPDPMLSRLATSGKRSPGWSGGHIGDRAKDAVSAALYKAGEGWQLTGLNQRQ